MIKNLRKKFIALAMASLLLVMTLIIGTVNLINYRNIVSDADVTLQLLAYYGGMFPLGDGGFDRPGGMNSFSPEMPYETRYFSVLFDTDNNVINTNVGRIAAVDAKQAQSYAEQVVSGRKTSGFTGVYRYISVENNVGTLVVFLDCSRSLSTCRAFLLTSCGISLAGISAVFLLLLVFSGRIIKPVSESYEKQKRFITDAGHELKTPLTVIDADTELLKMEHGESEWLQDIRSQTKRLAALTGDLISLARMEEAQPASQMIEFPFSDLVEETAQSFNSLAQLQDKKFSSSIQPMISLVGDANALRKLVSVLLDNALKYSGEHGTIELKLEAYGRGAHLTVFNTTASPVTDEQLSHMFDRFYRGDASRSSSTGGYGLGLSIARAVVQSHKGKISAATQDGQSLTVSVYL